MNYKFFENKTCEYYPCHKNLEEINCLFCFCPMYKMKTCLGEPRFLPNGIKDCSSCSIPHNKANYNIIVSVLADDIKSQQNKNDI